MLVAIIIQWICVRMFFLLIGDVSHYAIANDNCYGRVNDGFCYTFHEEEVSWTDAQVRCRRRHGTLAAIHDSTTQRLADAILSDLEQGAVWIGGQKTDPLHTLGNPASLWRWVDKDCPGCSMLTACTGGELDLAFLLDNSGSVSSDEWNTILHYVKQVVEDLDIGENSTQVAVAKFGNHAEGVIPLGHHSNKTSLLAWISGISHEAENTNMTAGLHLLHTEIYSGDRPHAPNVAIVISHGKSTMSTNSTVTEAQHARDAGIQLYVIGITDQVDENEISQISSPPQQADITYWLVPDYQSLSSVNFLPVLCSWQKRLNIIQSTSTSSQGCYRHDVTSPELPVVVSPSSVTPETCSDTCSHRGYIISGVHVMKSNASGSETTTAICRCGVEFGHYGVSGDCTVPCPDKPEVYCGGYKANTVTKANGMYVQWSRGEPNNMMRYQFCGAMDSRWNNTWYKVTDENCHDKLRFMCHLPDSACANDNLPNDGYYEVTSRLGMCVYTSFTLLGDTWHRSRRICLNKGGDLLTIRDSTQHADARDLLKSHYTKEADYTWIGIESHAMFWVTDEPTEITWMNFAPNEPDFSSGDCLYMDTTEKNQWRTANCTQDTAMAYICQREFQQPTSEVNIITSHKMMSEEIFQTYQPTTKGVPSQELGASSSQQNFAIKYWWVLLIIVVLTCAVLVLIIVFCYHKKKSVPQQESPRVRLWDAAFSDQGSPISFVNHDESCGLSMKTRKLYYSDLNSGYLIKARGGNGNFFTQTDKIYLP